jgi:hypothetical protein
MPKVVHLHQFGFIKRRTIQDCWAWAFQFLHFCHQSKKQVLILKLDLEKAFDKFERPVILQMLQHKGFSPRWVSWIHQVLSFGTFAVLLKGTPFTIVNCFGCGPFTEHFEPSSRYRTPSSSS